MIKWSLKLTLPKFLCRSDGFEVVSSNGQHELSLFFNATTADVMSEWISAISDTITKLNKNEVNDTFIKTV